MSKFVKQQACVLACALLLSACAPNTPSVKPAEVRQTVAQDLVHVYRHGDVTEPLKLEDVLVRALRYNLDTRVAQMDELIASDDADLQLLESLPSVSGKLQRVGRSNPGGSSSFSLLTGTQSLQPSISTDQYHTTQLLNIDWNLLDAGINLGRSFSASDKVRIAQERRRKIYHNVVQDTWSAYWRAAVSQSALPQIDALLADTDDRLKQIDRAVEEGVVPLGDAQAGKAKLMDRRRQLMNMKENMILSETELKTLIDYPPDQPITLDLQSRDWLSPGTLPKLKGSIKNFEQTAFMNRPEVREELLNKRLTLRDIKLSIIETFPGMEFILGFNHDDNSFLAYNSWVDEVFSLTQSINKIITAPVRYDRAKKADELADKRRQALLAAIITQVHISKARFDHLSDIYAENEQANRNSEAMLRRASDYSDVGMLSEADLLNARIDAGISAINRAIAYAEVQDAYGRFINTMGIDLWNAGNAGLSVPDFARQIRDNIDNMDVYLTSSGKGGVKG